MDVASPELETRDEIINKYNNSVIRFYKPDEEYGFMSNFYPSNMVIGGITYKTVEHYYQWRKFVTRPKIRAKIMKCETAKEVYTLARKYPSLAEPNWLLTREVVMYEILKIKFSNTRLRKMLLDTGDAELIESNPHDSFWGDGYDGYGLNRLGTLLMRLRKELAERDRVKSN